VIDTPPGGRQPALPCQVAPAGRARDHDDRVRVRPRPRPGTRRTHAPAAPGHRRRCGGLGPARARRPRASRRALAWPALTANEAGAAAFIGRYLREEGGRRLLLVLDDGGALVGGTVLLRYDPEPAAVELGCWIVTGHEGQGVMRRACVATVAHARRHLAVNRIVWTAASGNRRSRALAERLGFRPEGRLREAAVHDGRPQDLDVLSLVGAEIDAALRRSEATPPHGS
jgi:ribosomal-protein-serine acetyltransferase